MNIILTIEYSSLAWWIWVNWKGQCLRCALKIASLLLLLLPPRQIYIESSLFGSGHKCVPPTVTRFWTSMTKIIIVNLLTSVHETAANDGTNFKEGVFHSVVKFQLKLEKRSTDWRYLSRKLLNRKKFSDYRLLKR